MSTATPEIDEVVHAVPGPEPGSIGFGYGSIKPWLDSALAVVLLVARDPDHAPLHDPGEVDLARPAIYTQKRLGLGGKSSRSTRFGRCTRTASETAVRDWSRPRRSSRHAGRPVFRWTATSTSFPSS